MIDNTDDVIDSRDVIERLEEMESELAELGENIDLAEDDEESKEAREALKEWNDDNRDELERLGGLCAEGEGATSEWKDGTPLINDNYFSEYAEDFCKDFGDIPSDLPWYISNHIDLVGVAEEIQVDYSSIDFDGTTFWVR